MAAIFDSVVQSINFIEENLQEDLSVRDVAGKACYSLYHFIRLFEGVTGHTPKDYILRRRISEAFLELHEGKKKIIDVCFDYRFGSPEVFSRAFKRVLGINPGELKKLEYYPDQALLSPLHPEALRHGQKVRETPVEEISLETIELMGMVTLIRKDKKIIDELWMYLFREFNGFRDVPPTDFYGHSYWSNDYDLQGFFLMCGIPCDPEWKPSAPLCRRTIPASRYLKFTHKGDVSSISLSYKFIFQSFLPKSEYGLSQPFDFELYHPTTKGPHDESALTDILIPVD